MRAVPDVALPGVRLQEEKETAVLTTPRWGLVMMLAASLIGSYFLFMQLRAGSR